MHIPSCTITLCSRSTTCNVTSIFNIFFRAYTATIYKDGGGATYLTETRHRIAYETRTIRKGDRYDLWLAPGGGAAIRLTPQR